MVPASKRKRWLRMTDFIANDNEDRWGADRVQFFAETERRGCENQSDRWPVAKEHPDPVVAYSQRTTAAERFGRSILIIAVLSALSWAAVTLIVIAALSAL